MIIAANDGLVFEVGKRYPGTSLLFRGFRGQSISMIPFLVLREATEADWLEGLISEGSMPHEIEKDRALARQNNVKHFYEISVD